VAYVSRIILQFIFTSIAFITLGKAPGAIPVRNRDLESSVTVWIRDREP
jgi:hypothetical protein